MRKSLSMAAVAVLATSLTACSATGGRKAEEQASMNAGKATTPRMTVALITHSGPGDTFWDIVRKGAEDAAAKDNVKLEYTSDPDGSKQSNLVQQAVEGLAVQWQQLAHAQQAAQRQHVFVNRIGHAGIADLDDHLTAVHQLGAVHLAN